MSATLTLSAVGAGIAALLFPRVQQRWALSRAKHPSLAGHSRMAKRIARWVPGYAYSEQEFFASDQAPIDVQTKRREGLARLSDEYQGRYARTLEQTAEARQHLPDLQFTGAYRVPYQYSKYLRTRLSVGAFLQASSGVKVTDLDGNEFFDLTGSYGVNVFGYDFYKECIRESVDVSSPLGPVLGAYHPCVADNAARICRISGMDAVSFHMSGTEAVMQAVRLARFHTRKKHLVRFSGAYHGWWEDVQPGPGNPMPPRETYTLRECHPRSLMVLRHRKDIACVLINPLQALHPNANAPADSSLIDSGRQASYDRTAYTAWLKELRKVCTERGIALIFDEVFLGFRLAKGGAQEYFGVQADLVTYGKTLGGGLPVGVIAGKSQWMKRFREESPADICFARGTFKEHPYVMASMNAFLRRIDTADIQRIYDSLESTWNSRAARLNDMLKNASVPVRVAAMSTVWTVLFTQPARYNWMLQFYLRRHGLALSWVGSGRIIFSLNYSEADFDEVARRFVLAAQDMQTDGWWWNDGQTTNKQIRRTVLREMLRQTFRRT